MELLIKEKFNRFIENATTYSQNSYKEYWTNSRLKIIHPELYKDIIGEYK